MNANQKLTLTEAIAYLADEYGLNKPRSTVQTWLTKGVIPGVRIGGMWYVGKSDLDAFIKADPTPQDSETEIDDDRVDDAEEECEAEGV